MSQTSSPPLLSLFTLVVGVGLLVAGHGIGLTAAPEEQMMGDVGRIFYVHVPTAWVCLVVYSIAFVAAIGSLWRGGSRWDARVEGAIEVGVLMNALLLVQGSIWAKPTWDVWWTWDPRLTTTAVMVVAFGGVIVLRGMIQNIAYRATATAVATIVAAVNVPVVYMSVKWWNSLHQMQSSPETVDEAMHLPLRLAAFGMLFLSLGFVGLRTRIARMRLDYEDRAPDLPAPPAPLEIPGQTTAAPHQLHRGEE